MKRFDDSGYLINLSILQIIGLIMFAACSVGMYAHALNVGQDTFLGMLYEWSWLIFGLACGLFAARFIQDPKLVLIIAIVMMALWQFMIKPAIGG